MRLFQSIFVPLPPFLYGEYVVRFVPSGWCFLPCDHRLDFAERKGSIRQRRRIGYIFLNENCVGHDLGTVDSFVVILRSKDFIASHHFVRDSYDDLSSTR